jgi:hypothetical protein
VESQLLVFFKSSPDSTQQPAPITIQYLLVLTYVALIFSVSATISSLVLTRNIGNVPGPIGRMREHANDTTKRGIEISPFRTRSNDIIAPRRWRWIEWHCKYDALRSPGTAPLTDLFISSVVHASRVCAMSLGPDLVVCLDA